jgi:hypothetical protein
MIPSFLAGLIAGVVHVLSGPDHLTAVAPIAAAHPARAGFRGMLWGLGHTLAVAVVAGVAFLFREALPLDALSQGSERIVGLVLVGIGLWTLRSAFRTRAHIHSHQHDGRPHAHFHIHRSGHEPEAPAQRHQHGHAAFGIGALHGLAGSSHLLGVLPALALPDRGTVVAYLAGYGTGAVASMGLFGWGIGHMTARAAETSAPLYRRLLAGAGTAAIAVGIFWIAR